MGNLEIIVQCNDKIYNNEMTLKKIIRGALVCIKFLTRNLSKSLVKT